MQSPHPPVEFSGERRTRRKKKYDERKQPGHRLKRGAYQTRRTGTLQKFKRGGAEEFQHRTAAHHRDVHGPRPSLHRP